MNVSRRRFLGGTAAAALLGRAAATVAPAPGSPRHKLNEFAYSQVTLTGGPLAGQYRRVHAHYLKLDEDRLLKVYRQRAGLPAPGADMGGWYDADGFVPGHLLGQFISGLARLSAATGDAEAAAKARRLVDGYAAAFEKDGNPYASPKASATWACYVLDKYGIGLLDAASLLDCEPARRLLPRVIDAATRFIPDHVHDRIGVRQPPYDEPYILPENLFKTHELTGDTRFLEMAKKYLLDEVYFTPLAEGRDILPGKHGYSHVIALSSGAKAYEVLGDTRYLHALRNAWDMLEQTQQYASGAWAPQEMFVRPHQGELAASLVSTHDHFETPCGYYAHSKFARYLLAFTAGAHYGDGLERILLNTILGALDPDEDGGYFYYSSYHSQSRKCYYQRKWPCCAGTLVQSVADYPIDLYFWDERGVYVNLFAESELRWKVNGVPVKLAQRTLYPESETVELCVEPSSPAEFTVNVRIPGWLQRPAQLAVNGKRVSLKAERGTFASIRRRWRRNDTVEITLPFTFRTVPIDDRNPDIVAVMRGPVLMTAIDPPAELSATASALERMAAVPGKPLEFDCRTSSGNVRLRPFYQVQRETYSTYFKRVREA
jgi:DUF1680 family protein